MQTRYRARGCNAASEGPGRLGGRNDFVRLLIHFAATVGRMLERRVEGLGEGRLRRHRGRRRTTEAGWHFFARRTDRMRPGGSFTRAQCAWDSRWMHSPAHACVLGLCRILGRTVAGQRAAQTQPAHAVCGSFGFSPADFEVSLAREPPATNRFPPTHVVWGTVRGPRATRPCSLSYSATTSLT